MREEGTVVEVEDGRATVRMEPGEHCQGCNICARLSGETCVSVSLDEGAEVGVGDRVSIEVPAELSYTGILLVYGLPLAGLLAGAVTGSLIVDTWLEEVRHAQLVPVVLSLLGVLAGFLVTWRHQRRRASKTGEQIRMVKVIQRASGDQHHRPDVE